MHRAKGNRDESQLEREGQATAFALAHTASWPSGAHEPYTTNVCSTLPRVSSGQRSNSASVRGSASAAISRMLVVSRNTSFLR